MAAGYFLLTKSGNQFKFALKAGNHETILSSELLRVQGERAERHRLRQDQLGQRCKLRAQDLQG